MRHWYAKGLKILWESHHQHVSGPFLWCFVCMIFRLLCQLLWIPHVPGFNLRSSFRSTRLRVALVSAKWTHSALIHMKAGNWWHPSQGKYVEDRQGKIGATSMSKLETWAGEEHLLRQWAMSLTWPSLLGCRDTKMPTYIPRNDQTAHFVRRFNDVKPPYRLQIQNDNDTKMSWVYHLKTSVIPLIMGKLRPYPRSMP